MQEKTDEEITMELLGLAGQPINQTLAKKESEKTEAEKNAEMALALLDKCIAESESDHPHTLSANKLSDSAPDKSPTTFADLCLKMAGGDPSKLHRFYFLEAGG